MAGAAGSGNPACGHPVQPGSRFLPGLRSADRRQRCAVRIVDGAVASGPRFAAVHRAAVLCHHGRSDSRPARFRALGLLVCAPVAAARPSGPQLWPAPPDGGQSPPAGPDPTRVDDPGPVLPGDLPTAMLGDLRLAAAPGSPRRFRRPLVPVIVAAALVAVLAGVVIFRVHSGTAASGTTGTTPPASSQDARRQAAVRGCPGCWRRASPTVPPSSMRSRTCAAAARPCARTRGPSPPQPVPGSACCPGSGACPGVLCCLPRCCRT